MHEVLGLPGPGAGIALVLGPFLILVVLIAARLSGKDGGAVLTAVTFAAVYALVVRLLGIPTNPKGAFGSAAFVVAVGLFGLIAEAVLVFGRALRGAWCCAMSGAVANAALLVFYWIGVFPRTAGWVSWGDVPVLMGLCLVSGLASGYIAWGLSRRLARVFACKEKE
jgi:hypothetical protein